MSDSALELCRKNNPRIRFEKGDLYSPRQERCDLVLCIDTLEHLEYPERAIRNLLGNGIVCLVVPNGRQDTFEGHIHYWSPESFRLFLEQQQCSILHTRVWGEFGEQLVLIKRK